MMIDICKLFILLLLNSSCITHKEQLYTRKYEKYTFNYV